MRSREPTRTGIPLARLTRSSNLKPYGGPPAGTNTFCPLECESRNPLLSWSKFKSLAFARPNFALQGRCQSPLSGNVGLHSKEKEMFAPTRDPLSGLRSELRVRRVSGVPFMVNPQISNHAASPRNLIFSSNQVFHVHQPADSFSPNRCS